jgi:deazaflavin-dependent oxidoreductase (nitroreductase family)
MPIPRTIARLNKAGLNRVTVHVAPWLPGFGVVVHRGRKSGRTYRTPVNVFAAPGGYTIALTYGTNSDWLRNVVAAGGCELITRGRTVQATSPRVYRDEARSGIRVAERQILGLLHVSDFLALQAAPGPAPTE